MCLAHERATVEELEEAASKFLVDNGFAHNCPKNVLRLGHCNSPVLIEFTTAWEKRAAMKHFENMTL